MEERLHLSVVIPAYNEEERLRKFVPGIVEFLRSKGQPFEIVVVDDGSRDGTGQVARELAKTYPMLRLIELHPNRGKGGAVKAGMLDARGQYVMFTDADQSTPITEVDKLLEKLEREGYDMAIGSRAVTGRGSRATASVVPGAGRQVVRRRHEAVLHPRHLRHAMRFQGHET